MISSLPPELLEYLASLGQSSSSANENQLPDYGTAFYMKSEDDVALIPTQWATGYRVLQSWGPATVTSYESNVSDALEDLDAKMQFTAFYKGANVVIGYTRDLYPWNDFDSLTAKGVGVIVRIGNFK